MQALQLTAEWAPRPDYTPTPRERAEQRAENANLVYRKPALHMVSLPDPRPGPGEVRVRVRACGVCGSDLHMIEVGSDGYMASADPARLPIALGHEFAGVVDLLGPGVEGLSVGDPVCVESGQWCAVCEPCRAGIFGQCANLNEHGFSLDGGFAEYVVTRPQYCWSLAPLQAIATDDDALYELGALVEPFSVIYNALFVRAGGFLPGSNVAVFGSGPVGLAAVLFARFAGAGTIVAFDTMTERLELALKAGADAVINPVALAAEGVDPAERVWELTGGIGIGLGIEAAGAGPRTFPVLERCMALGGKVVQIGVGAGQTPVTMIRAQTRNLNLYGSMGSSGAGIFPAVIRILASGRLPARDIITVRYPLEQALAAFARTEERRDGKVMVRA